MKYSKPELIIKDFSRVSFSIGVKVCRREDKKSKEIIGSHTVIPISMIDEVIKQLQELKK